MTTLEDFTETVAPRNDGQRIGVFIGAHIGMSSALMQSAMFACTALVRAGHAPELIVIDEKFQPSTLHAMDVAFLGFADGYAEHGRLQGLLSLAGIPYTGSGVLASAISMHKPNAKAVIKYSTDVPLLPHILIDSDESSASAVARIGQQLGKLIIVKPNSEGSSSGVALTRSHAELREAVSTIRESGRRFFAEPYFPGRDITVAVLDQGRGPIALPPVEVGTANDILDSRTKAQAQRQCPASIPKEISESVSKAAVRVHQALGCRGYSRSDFILSPTGDYCWLETNALPSLRQSASFATAAASQNILYGDLILRILETARSHKIAHDFLSAEKV